MSAGSRSGNVTGHCRDALADAGDADAAAELLSSLLAQGNGAAFQRDAYRRSGRLSDVIGDAVAVTERAKYWPGRRFCWLERCIDR